MDNEAIGAPNDVTCQTFLYKACLPNRLALPIIRNSIERGLFSWNRVSVVTGPLERPVVSPVLIGRAELLASLERLIVRTFDPNPSNNQACLTLDSNLNPIADGLAPMDTNGQSAADAVELLQGMWQAVLDWLKPISASILN